jgi:hypothetical protein
LVRFFQTFSTDLKSAWNSAFFLVILVLFSNFDCNAQETAQKRKIFFWMCLRIWLCNHQRVCITKLLKSLYPNAHRTHVAPEHTVSVGSYFLSCKLNYTEHRRLLSYIVSDLWTWLYLKSDSKLKRALKTSFKVISPT